MSHEIYNQDYLKDELVLIKAHIKALDEWSAYNDDKINREVDILQQTVELLEENNKNE